MKKLQLLFIFLLLSIIGFGGLTSTAPTIMTIPGHTEYGHENPDDANNSVTLITKLPLDGDGVTEDPTLTGPTSVCLSSTGNVYTTEAGQLDYIWVVTGGTVTAGGTSTSNTATVTWTAAGAKSISVTYAGATTTVLPVTVNPLTSSIAISASATSVFTGTPVTFTATPTNGGTLPVYQWKVNGANMGTNSPVFTYTPLNGDAVYCILTPNAPCVSSSFTSGVITITVTSKPIIVTIPTITAIPGQTVCFPVKLTGANTSGTPISGVNLQISFDPAVLQYDTLVNFYAGMPALQWFYSGNLNTVAANWQEPSALTLAVPDNTTLFEIKFTYIGGAAALPFTVSEFTDVLYNLINNNHIGGGISPFVSLPAGYLACDFHQHTTYTDGSYTFSHMMQKNNQFGLSWWANSEHGGAFNRDATYSGTDLGTTLYWDSYVPNPVIGTVSISGGHQNMWRWQSLRDYSFQNIQIFRALYPSKMIFQSYELNVPGHEHAGLGIINNQFDVNPNCNPLAEFEFKFDAGDNDLTGGVAQGWTKSALGNVHAKAVEAVTWLQTNYPSTSYLVAAHAERKSLNNIQGFRDMNNAGPDVCFGFESMPGHQKAPDRGEYKIGYNTFGTSTYGGCGIYAARVGGLWDAMLSEGRGWWLFASSDFHATEADFYPGEYQKTYTYVADRNNPQSYVDALRSGNSYVVEGDLIDSLDFKVGETAAMSLYATIGQTFNTTNGAVVVKIKVHDPQGNNNNTYSVYTNPSVDHIDLIMGKVGGKIAPETPGYSVDTVNTTSVIARFDAVGGITSPNGVVSQAWTDLGEGWKEVTYSYNNLVDSVYFRLRGTNQGLNATNETDANGNPLTDALMYPNNATKAFADLWFYSNPIFVAGPVSPKLNGPSTVCVGSAGNVYTTDAGKTSYSWSLTGGTITAGGSSADSAATVTWNTAGVQNISVSYDGSTTTSLPVTVNPQLPVSVTITASANPVCANTSVTFTATPVNGGATPVYQWKKNGSNVGTNNPVYTYNPVNNDVVTCILTSSDPCNNGSPATSNAITMTVNPLTASISITASANPVAPGTPVTFTANPTNGGTAPGFQWKVNGANTGTNSPTFIFTPANGDVVYCILASNAPCVTSLFTSNLITMNVSYPAGTLSVTLPNKSAMPGDVLYYPVKLKGAGNGGYPISGADIQISYDPAVLHYDTLVNFYQAMTGVWFYSGNFNTVAANWNEPNAGTFAVPDSTTLFEIKFTYLGGTGTLPFIVSDFTDAALQLIPTSQFNGGVTQLVPSNNTVQNVDVVTNNDTCFNALQAITVAGNGTSFNVQAGGSATFVAGQMISFMAGTKVNSGGYLYGYITSNGQYCNQTPNPVVAAKDSQEETASVPELSSNHQTIRAYPNPTTGIFTVEVKGDSQVMMTKAEIYSMSGAKVQTVILANERKHEFSVSQLTPGIYFIHVFTDERSEILKIVKL